MNIIIENNLQEDQWRDYVNNHPHGNIFHTPEMFQVFTHVKGYKPEIWAGLNKHKQILSLFLPVHITLYDGLLSRLTTRTTVFGGILVNPDPEGKDALVTLLKAYQEHSGKKSLFTEIRNMSPIDGYQPLIQDMKFAYEEQLNYIIDLTPSPEEVFNRIGKRTRKNIRNGRNKGLVTIKTISDHADVLESYELLEKSYHNARVPLSDFSLFTAAFDHLSPKGMLKIRTAMVKDHPAATSIELFYKTMIFGWYGGLDRAYSTYNPNDLLMAYVLESGSADGYRMYDFGGAGKSDEYYGVRDYKAKFGGNLVNYGRNTWIPHPGLFSFCNFSYEMVRKVTFA